MYLRSACHGTNCTVPDCKHQKRTRVLRSGTTEKEIDYSSKSSEVVSTNSTAAFEFSELINLSPCSVKLTEVQTINISRSSGLNAAEYIRYKGNDIQVTDQNSGMARTYDRSNHPEAVSAIDSFSRRSLSRHSADTAGVRRVSTRSSSRFSAASCSSERISKNSSVSRSSSKNHHYDNSSQPWEVDESSDEDVQISEETAVPNNRLGNWQYFFRKYLYFALSKPLHYDIECHYRINKFGKKTILFLVLLSLFLFLFYSGAFQNFGLLKSHYVPVQMSSYIDSSYEMLSQNLPAFALNCLKMAFSLMVLAVDKLSSISFAMWPVTQQKDQNLSPTINLTPLMNGFHVPSDQRLTKEDIEIIVQSVLEKNQKEILNKNYMDLKLAHEEIMKIKNEFTAFRSAFDTSFSNVEGIQSRSQDKLTMFDKDRKILMDQILQKDENLKQKFLEIQKSYILLNETIQSHRNCCQNDSQDVLVDSILEMVLLSMMSDDNPRVQAFHTWLSTHFVDHEKFLKKLETMRDDLVNFKDSLRRELLVTLSQETMALKQEIVTSTAVARKTSGALSHEDVLEIVEKVLKTYDADKTGEVDYALESGGGSVMNTRCTEAYSEKSPMLSFFGFQLWNLPSNPRQAIQPGVHLGQCWAFKGSQGYLVIQLSYKIRPTGFVIEHIPKSLSPTGNLDSAPNSFSVWGLTSEKDYGGKLLGKYKYDIEKESLQYFPVQVENSENFLFVELKIHTNHGNFDFTCLYRFRVHGLQN